MKVELDPMQHSRGRWSENEHRLFIKGLKRYGKNWVAISQFIHTRTSNQVRSHAQKFFLRSELVKRKVENRPNFVGFVSYKDEGSENSLEDYRCKEDFYESDSESRIKSSKDLESNDNGLHKKAQKLVKDEIVKTVVNKATQCGQDTRTSDVGIQCESFRADPRVLMMSFCQVFMDSI